MNTSAPTLDYGLKPERDYVRLAKRLARIAFVLSVIGATLYLAARRYYWLDRASVQAALEELPGAASVRVDGFDDGPSWTVAGAEVCFGGTPVRTISFQSPRRGELQSGRRMCVREIGPYWVDVDVDDPRMSVQFLDVGRESEFRDVFPFRIENVADLAARYDEIVQFVGKEPSGVYTTADGKTCRYKITVRPSGR